MSIIDLQNLKQLGIRSVPEMKYLANKSVSRHRLVSLRLKFRISNHCDPKYYKIGFRLIKKTVGATV